MGIYLNSCAPYDAYKEMSLDTYFVDKTMLIAELIPALGRKNRYFCITRPRRFGKTVMVNMIRAAFGVNFMVFGIENQEEVNYLMPLRGAEV